MHVFVGVPEVDRSSRLSTLFQFQPAEFQCSSWRTVQPSSNQQAVHFPRGETMAYSFPKTCLVGFPCGILRGYLHKPVSPVFFWQRLRLAETNGSIPGRAGISWCTDTDWGGDASRLVVLVFIRLVECNTSCWGYPCLINSIFAFISDLVLWTTFMISYPS